MRQEPNFMLIQATPAEVITLNTAINFCLANAQYIPSDARQLLRQFQQRLVDHLPPHAGPALERHNPRAGG